MANTKNYGEVIKEVEITSGDTKTYHKIDSASVDGHTVESTGVESDTTTLPTTAQVKEFVNKNITSEGTTKSAVAYQDNVSANACPYAILNTLGGMSYKSENLLIPVSSQTTSSSNGVVFTKNTDGSVVLNGASEANQYSCFVNLYMNTSSFPNGIKAGDDVYFKLFGNATNCVAMVYIYETSWIQKLDNTRKGTVQIPSDAIGLLVRIGCYNGKTFNNQVVYPMLISGTTEPTEYQPYFEGIRDSAITSVVLRGANLIDLQDIPETTTYGITYKLQDRAIYVSGTANPGNFGVLVNLNVSIPAGTYTFNIPEYSGVLNSGYFEIQLRTASASVAIIDYRYITTAITFTTTEEITSIRLYFSSSLSISNTIIIKPMLVKGSTAPTVYKPYVAPITKTIPQEIQALTGYGWGINDTCYNYINLNRKVFAQKAGRYTFTGNETITKTSTVSGGGYRFNVNIPYTVIEASAIKSNTLEYQTPEQMYSTSRADYGIAIRTTAEMNTVYIYVKDIENGTIADMREWLLNNPTTIYIELATPIETDISSYLPADFNSIQIEANGTITFDNTYQQAIPYEYLYDIGVIPIVDEKLSNYLSKAKITLSGTTLTIDLD